MTAPTWTPEPWPEKPGQLLVPLHDYPRAKACVDALAGLVPEYDCPECATAPCPACHGTGKLSAVQGLVQLARDVRDWGPGKRKDLEQLARAALERIKP